MPLTTFQKSMTGSRPHAENFFSHIFENYFEKIVVHVGQTMTKDHSNNLTV